MAAPNPNQRHPAALRILFAADSSLAFKLLIILLAFNAFRPDRLLPGGSFTLYVPTLLLLILALLWIQAPRKILDNPQTRLFFGFIVVMAIGSIFARNMNWAVSQLKSMFFYVFVPYLIIVQFVNSAYRVDRYIRLFLILNTFLVGLGIANKGLVGIPALADENEFALFSNVLLPIAYFLGQEATVKWKKVLYYSIVAFLIFATVTSASRGGLLGLVAVTVFLFFSSSRKIYAGLLLIFFSLVFLYFGSHGSGRYGYDYWGDMSTIFMQGADSGTGRDRWESWKAGWGMFLDNPIFGVGPKNFGMWLTEYYTSWEEKRPEMMWGRVAHSVYFTLIPETGLAGTILFAAIIWRNFRDHVYIANLEKYKSKLLKGAKLNSKEFHSASTQIRKLYLLSLGYSGSIIAFLTTGAFVSVLWYDYIWILTAFCVVTSNVAKNIKQALLVRTDKAATAEDSFQGAAVARNRTTG